VPGRGRARLEALVRAHEQAVYRLALSMLDDPAEADEAAQDSFVTALRAFPN
jgi:RNA polymerase sigma-70 factor (ECF subfamily)